MAVPNPEKELARLRGVLKKELPQVTVLTGPSSFFRGQAIDEVLEMLPKDAELRSLSGDKDVGDGEELQDLCGAALFGRGSWLVVRRGDAWLREHGAKLVTLLPRFRAGCGLVLETGKIDKRTKIGKALGKPPAALFEFRDLYDSPPPFSRTQNPAEAELVEWIAQRGRKCGVPLTPEAALLLMNMVGKDPAECLAELERLAPQLGKSKKAHGPEQIASLLSGSPESTQFELADALLAGDRARTLRSLEALFGRGLRQKDGKVTADRAAVFPMVTSWLYRSLSNAYEGRFLVDQGVPLRDVPGRLGVRTFVDRFIGQVSDNSEARLRRGLVLLHRAQRELRFTGEDAHWILRRMIDRYFEDVA